MKSALVFFLAFIPLFALASNEIVGEWSNEFTDKGLRQVWHFRDDHTIIRQYYIGTNEGMSWYFMVGKWSYDDARKEGLKYYTFHWETGLRGGAHFESVDGISCLIVSHGDIVGFGLRPVEKSD
ncbi:MAG: hypothetical protein ACQKBV_14175, partial [Puniceicoccales bacterium]